MDACTIIAKNYLAYARVLAESYARQHPDSKFYVLIIDDAEGYVDAAAEPFELVTPGDLDIDGFERMAVIYDVLELSTAVKPWLLRWLLARSDGRGALYLDPDMLVQEPLTELFALIERHKLVLSPHSLEPMPRDGKRPNEQDILIAGVYNLGFIGIGSGKFADELLDWWSERLESDCIIDPERGFFVDQRWMDFVPGMAESFHLLRDPGFNVAYWNLTARPVSRRDGRWYVKGDVPLRLFHFSGFDPTRPHVLSKHQDRIRLGDHPDVAELCRRYADELISHGALEVAGLPYSYASTASGFPINKVMRRFFRDLVVDGFEGSLFEPEGEAAFAAAANEPAETPEIAERGITRYLAALHEARPDIQWVYPNLAGPEAAGYLDWIALHGRDQIPIPDELLPPAQRRDAAGAEPAGGGPAPAWALGVNVAGYLRSELGIGEIARGVIEALDTQGIPTLPVGLQAPQSRQAHQFADVTPSPYGFPVNLVCVNADMLSQFAAEAGPDFFADRHTIGLWWWEVSTFPEQWLDAFDHVDEVWAGSAFVAEALASVARTPVIRIPTPVRLPAVQPVERTLLGLPDDFIFMFVFDYNSVFARKNPLGLLDAFVRAFPAPGDGASLVLKSINAEHHVDEHEQLKVAAAEHPHVKLLDYYVSAADKNRLIASCDCYVSLHRSEGFGITMAEAMLLGKPVVATGYSGNLDYMTHENSYLVDYELQPIGRAAGPYPADGEWAEPDLGHAAALLREVFEDRAEAARRGERAARDIEANHSLEVVGAAMARRLKAVEGKVPTTREDSAWSARQQGANARELVRTRSQSPGKGPLGRLRRLPRRVALRLMKPHTAHQARIDAELAAGLVHAGEDLMALKQAAKRQVTVEAAVLRELRLLRGADDEQAWQFPRIDDVVGQVDELRAKLEHHRRALIGVDLAPLDGAAVARDGYPSAPVVPWSHEYNEAHAAFVAHELDDAVLMSAFRKGAPLPEGLGLGFDERVVEFPWTVSRALSGRVLDAGSTLNHLHVLARVRSRVDELHIVTLSPEESSFPQLGVSYIYADLRELPIKDGAYDRAVSISTLEHVGMDNTVYGTGGTATDDPQRECLRAVEELGRVLAPGGDLYITVPVGRGERYAWVRSLTLDELSELAEAFPGEQESVTFFRHDPSGWRRAEADEVGDARYRDHFTTEEVGPDRVVAAEAVGCLHLVKR